jgi:hypothetical protein
MSMQAMSPVLLLASLVLLLACVVVAVVVGRLVASLAESLCELSVPELLALSLALVVGRLVVGVTVAVPVLPTLASMPASALVPPLSPQALAHTRPIVHPIHPHRRCVIGSDDRCSASQGSRARVAGKPAGLFADTLADYSLPRSTNGSASPISPGASPRCSISP